MNISQIKRIAVIVAICAVAIFGIGRFMDWVAPDKESAATAPASTAPTAEKEKPKKERLDDFSGLNTEPRNDPKW